MQLQIPAELAQFVQSEIDSGRFGSEQEVVFAALRLLQDDRELAVAGIREGLAQFDRDEGIPISQAFAEIRGGHRGAE